MQDWAREEVVVREDVKVEHKVANGDTDVGPARCYEMIPSDQVGGSENSLKNATIQVTGCRKEGRRQMEEPESMEFENNALRISTLPREDTVGEVLDRKVGVRGVFHPRAQ